MMSILDLLARSTDNGGRIHGVVTGTVTNNQDPEKLGRVKMCFPWLAQAYESEWARVAVPMAGKERGTWLIPDVGDEVLVAFDQGDLLHPYVVGSLWSQAAGPPPAGAEAGSEVRMLRSRSGHVIRLDDRKGQERIEITDGSGKSSIVIDTKDNAITLTCEGDLTLESKNGKVVVKAAKGVDLAATGKEAGVDVTATANVKVTGKRIDLN